MEERIVLFGLDLKIVNNDENTDSCSECVFRGDKCPLFKGKSPCQDAEGRFSRHFVKAEQNKNIRPPRHSVPYVIADIMTKVWCYDISFIHDLNRNCLPAKDKAYIKKSVETGTAMRVMTHPELREYKDSDICVKEYFIAVTIPGISYEFYILNCKSCLHKTYNDLKDWLIAQELSDLCDS